MIEFTRRHIVKEINVINYSYKNNYRLQNSPYFCVFKYARAIKQKVWNEAENREHDWGETLKNKVFSLSPHTRVRLVRFARIRLLRHALPISLLILRKKPTVLQSRIIKNQPVISKRASENGIPDQCKVPPCCYLQLQFQFQCC